MVLIISSLSVVPGIAASALPGSLLEKQISSPHPRCTESGTQQALQVTLMNSEVSLLILMKTLGKKRAK